MNKIYPKKLKKGSHVRVIAPADSMFAMTNNARRITKEKIEKEFGLRVSFGKNVEKRYDEVFDFAAIEERIENLHEAFLDSSGQRNSNGLGRIQ